MRKNPGYIVQFKNSDGSMSKGIVYHSEQTKEFTNYNKVFIRVTDNDMNSKLDEFGRKIAALKHINLVTRIGFTD